jgi:hypothetical protein
MMMIICHNEEKWDHKDRHYYKPRSTASSAHSKFLLPYFLPFITFDFMFGSHRVIKSGMEWVALHCTDQQTKLKWIEN